MFYMRPWSLGFMSISQDFPETCQILADTEMMCDNSCTLQISRGKTRGGY
jgi:hypothetical protein